MVRAATTGAIDFTRFDSNDKWWWQKLKFVLEDLYNHDLKSTATLRHRHWSTILLADGLAPEAREAARVNIGETLIEVLSLYQPWLKEAFNKSETEDFETSYRNIHGYPGEERYEKMLAENAEAWRKINASWK